MTEEKKGKLRLYYFIFYGHDLSNDAHKSHSHTEVYAVPTFGLFK